jgi:S1-C subfamily serine protease
MTVMRNTWLAAALALACVCASAAEPAAPKNEDLEATRAELRRAQEDLRETTRRIAALSAKLGGDRAMVRYLGNPRRAMLGVVLGADADGVRLAAVTPGGPADKAGLRAGDRLVAINGKTFAEAGKAGPVERAVRGDDAVETARALIGEPGDGDAVRIAYLRDGKRHEATVKAERRESWNWPLLPGSGGELPGFDFDFDFDVDVQPQIEAQVRVLGDDVRKALEGVDVKSALDGARHELRRVMIFRDGGLYDLKLAALNPELGRYFGTDRGVLVLDKGSDSFLTLARGDVLVSIAGEPVDSPTSAMRAISRHEPGESVNVEVLRDRTRSVVVMEVPEASDFNVLVPPPPPRPPAPPSAPSPPAPPAPAVPPPPPSPPGALI